MVLLNPLAGGGQAAALAQPVRAWLATHAPGVALVESDSIERSRATLQCLPRSSRVVLIGGDGTLHHMLPVLLTHRLALGVVPLGSGNDTARALGVADLPWPRRSTSRCAARRAAWTWASWSRRASACRSSPASRPASMPPSARRAIEGPRWLGGMPRYLWATLGELASLRTHRVRIALDGAPCHEGEAIFASVLNTRSYGSGMPAVPGARVGDGRLDLLVAGRFGRIGTLLDAAAAAQGHAPGQRQGAHLDVPDACRSRATTSCRWPPTASRWRRCAASRCACGPAPSAWSPPGCRARSRTTRHRRQPDQA